MKRSPWAPVTSALIVVIVVVIFGAGASAEPAFPALTGRVVDEAHVLSPQAQTQLTQALADLEAKTSRQLVVVTLPSLQGYDIADYGYQLGRAWGIGQKGQNNGVLFIIAPRDRKTRIEVGYGLEGILTDALSSLILQQRVLPKFKAGDIEGGIVDGTSALIQQLSLDRSTAEKIAAQAAEQRVPTDSAPIPTSFVILFAIWIVMMMLSRRRSSLMAALPWILLSGGGGRRGFGGGQSGEDRGFGGGGGSFGGGGASGGW